MTWPQKLHPFRLYLNAGGRRCAGRDLPLHCFSGAMNPGCWHTRRQIVSSISRRRHETGTPEMERTAGLEPTTLSLEGSRSSY